MSQAFHYSLSGVTDMLSLLFARELVPQYQGVIMKTSIQSKRCRANFWAMRSAILIASLALSLPAFGALGDDLDSIYIDGAYMNATMKIRQVHSYAVHELRSPTGTVVREYVSADGRVFGVAWEGPFVPNMRQILGSYFQRYSEAAKAQRESRVGRRPLDIQEPGLVVQTAGHMRAYFGRAFAPELLPNGVNPDELR